MFDLIPIHSYTPLYYYILLFVVLFTAIQTYSLPINSNKILNFNKIFGSLVLIFLLFYMGLRPIDIVFTDMKTYSNIFLRYYSGDRITTPHDFFFHLFTKLSSQFISLKAYFFLCASLYVIPLYLVCKKWFKGYWFYAFLFLVTAFSFWSYGTNGIRNGIAGSLFLLGMSRDKRIWQIFHIVLAINFHQSMLLPAAGFLFTYLFNQPKKIIVFWILCIPLSLIGGDFFEVFFSSIGFDDDRLNYLTTEVDKSKFASIGFRWDFLLYSATGVFAGWYYIVKRKFNDIIYLRLFNTYLFANAFWILVIRANYSNRFAYLSWFMIGLIIIYPLLKKYIIKNQHKKIGIILIAYFTFTFLMNVILK